MKKGTMIGLALLLSWGLQGQAVSNHQYADNLNAWLMYFGDHKFSPKWGVHLEAQWRK